MINLTKDETFKGFSKLDKINYVQRQIIVHSIIYYNFDYNLISDKNYDNLCRLLMKFKEHWKGTYKKSQYYYCMEDFDGNTGFDLYYRLNKKDKMYLKNIARHIIKLSKGSIK